MCKYCEEIETQDNAYISYIRHYDHYLAFAKDEKQFELWDYDDEYCSDIEYCPWCGRKLELEAPKMKKGSLEKDIDRLQQEINQTNFLVKRLCQELAICLNSNGNRYVLANKLRDFADQL